MQIKKIVSIKGYKSFIDFKWNDFCNDRIGTSQLMQKYCIFYGENGSGKSSVCDILKSISQMREFGNKKPILAELEIFDGTNNNICKYENDKWSDLIDRNKFLFFDVDFINSNIHTNGLISNNLQQGAHTQKAGKLIIDLDDKANNYKITIKNKEAELNTLQNSHAFVLNKLFTEKDYEYYDSFAKYGEIETNNLLVNLENDLINVGIDLNSLNNLKIKNNEINKIYLINEINILSDLPTIETLTEIFNREIKDESHDEVDILIKNHFDKHKNFIETSINLITIDYQKEYCPFCMQPLINAANVIEYYRKAFDQTYEKLKHKYILDIKVIKNALIKLKEEINNLSKNVTLVFDLLENLKASFDIQNIYAIDEKAEFAAKFDNIAISGIDDLLANLDSLKLIDKKQINILTLYRTISSSIIQISTNIMEINKYIQGKNNIIKEFKEKYSDPNRIIKEILEKGNTKSEIESLIKYLRSDNVKLIKKQREIIAKQALINEDIKNANAELTNYLANTIPRNVTKYMIETLNNFNINFTLKHIRPASHTKDYPFSFEVIDKEGKNREFKNDLSEGERQLISISFFFAINENIQNKNNAILIFDDPVTSLDASNLRILSELIYNKTKEYSQVIVFTHHSLFFKYLKKYQNPYPSNFGLFKNTKEFGGSFIYFDKGLNLIEEVKRCNEEIKTKAQNGNLNIDEIALKYGQLLRLSIERFIKNDLLMWDKEDNFDVITGKLKQA